MAVASSFNLQAEIETCPERGHQVSLILGGEIDVANHVDVQKSLFERIAHLWEDGKFFPLVNEGVARVKVVLTENCLPTGELVRILDLVYRELRLMRSDATFVVTTTRSRLPQSFFYLQSRPYFTSSAN